NSSVGVMKLLRLANGNSRFLGSDSRTIKVWGACAATTPRARPAKGTEDSASASPRNLRRATDVSDRVLFIARRVWNPSPIWAFACDVSAINRGRASSVYAIPSMQQQLEYFLEDLSNSASAVRLAGDGRAMGAPQDH